MTLAGLVYSAMRYPHVPQYTGVPVLRFLILQVRCIATETEVNRPVTLLIQCIHCDISYISR